MGRATSAGVLLLACVAGTAAGAPAPPPGTDAEIAQAARGERRLVVYTTTDPAVAAPLLEDFSKLYPEIEVEFVKLESTALYERFLRELARERTSADVLWSSAMDLQMKLANDGFAESYWSPESYALPEWALWNGEAYGTTFEPIVFAYNRLLLRPEEVPQSHAGLVKLLLGSAERFRGRVVTYDPERSGLGYLLLTQDARIDPGFQDAVRAYAGVEIALSNSSVDMLREIASGKYLLGVNVIGSYAAQVPRSLGIVAPRDYTLAMSRIALIPKAAAHPNAARVFLDYLLSQRGQALIATRTSLGAIRSDVTRGMTARSLSDGMGSAVQPIRVSPSLLVFLDPLKRPEFLRRWHRGLGAR
jgi:iron(III) transport system substrate-binding protein